MINWVSLKNFKCFEVLDLPLANLTLLSGTNASGKSSVLQALVLLHQTMREHEWSTRLMLNGDALKLGTVADVVDKVHGRRTFEIGLVHESESYAWTFSGERDEMSVAVDSVRSHSSTEDNPKALHYLLPYKPDANHSEMANRLCRLTYITAERAGPREFYSLADTQVASVVGPTGEHAISVLHQGRDAQVVEGLVLADTPPTRLRQVEARMALFFPGCALVLQQIPQANAVTLGLRTSPDTDFHRPIHVGFGLSQVLPIVIAALSAEAGDILLIENPEVHLHPAGQAQMGQFLAEVARVGIQVILETHSDHVLNGIRRSVKEKKLPPESVGIHFFSPRVAGESQIFSPRIDHSGNIDKWPSGFFDQFDKDANYFAGWGE